MRWEQLLLDDAFTGGALAWLPGRTPRVRQLVYPAGGALDKLCIFSHRAGSQPAPSVGGGALGMVQGKGRKLGGLTVTRVHALTLNERPRFPRGPSDPRR